MNVEPVTNLGAIVGGVLGALAALVILVLIIVFVKRRSRRYVESLQGNRRSGHEWSRVDLENREKSRNCSKSKKNIKFKVSLDSLTLSVVLRNSSFYKK